MQKNFYFYSKAGHLPAGMGQSALCGLAHFCLRRKIVCASLNQFLDRFIHPKKFSKAFRFAPLKCVLIM